MPLISCCGDAERVSFGLGMRPPYGRFAQECGQPGKAVRIPFSICTTPTVVQKSTVTFSLSQENFHPSTCFRVACFVVHTINNTLLYWVDVHRGTVYRALCDIQPCLCSASKSD